MQEEGKSLFKRVMFDKENELDRKEFIICYFICWILVLVIIFLLSLFLSGGAIRGAGVGIMMSFVILFQQRLRYLRMNKWFGLLGIFPITNLPMFIFLAIKDTKK